MISEQEKTKEKFADFIEPNKGIIGRVSRLFTNNEEDRLDLYGLSFAQKRNDFRPEPNRYHFLI